jgi:hypothetical protein
MHGGTSDCRPERGLCCAKRSTTAVEGPLQFFTAAPLAVLPPYRHSDRSPERQRRRVEEPALSGRAAQVLTSPAITYTVGAPFLRALCEGAGTTNARSDGSTPPNLETKPSPTPHSLAPGLSPQEDKNDSCSTATAQAPPPVPVPSDCDACTSASQPASSSSKR